MLTSNFVHAARVAPSNESDSSTRDFPFPDDTTLMSVTDTESYVSYANTAFLQVSGYTRDQMMGRPHNLVRHPDMPKEAFADLWSTLQSGETWTALIKNRRANGIEHYWVRANVTPIRSGDGVVGYMSVRTRPQPEEIATAEDLYRAFRGGTAQRRFKFHKGLVVRRGLMGWTRIRQTLPVRWALRLGLGGVAGAAVGSAVAGGLPWAWALPPLVAGVLACAWLEARIARPLSRLSQLAGDVAAGHVDRNVYLNRVDEIGMTARALNQAGLNLRSLIGDVAAQIQGMQGNNDQIMQSNADLKWRTERTQDQLQETSAAAQEVAAAVQHGEEPCGGTPGRNGRPQHERDRAERAAGRCVDFGDVGHGEPAKRRRGPSAGLHRRHSPHDLRKHPRG